MKSIDLNGLWDFMVDLDPKYHSVPVYANPNWNRRNWQKVQVPGTWNKYSERLDIYEGVCWFAREFEIDNIPENAIAILRFGGINYKCSIFLNGNFVADHEGGYTEFTVDISNEIQAGKNYLAIEVDNRATQIKMPACLGYFNYGGIHRGVTLEVHNQPCCLKDVFIDAKPSPKGGLLNVTGRIVGCNKCRIVYVTCNNIESLSLLQDRRVFDITMEVPGASQWSPDSPNLYDVSVKLICEDKPIHEVVHKVGFRKIEVDNKKILLNGKPIFLKGICYLYDSPVHGVTMKPEQYIPDLSILKEMGVNAIRSHFPFTTEFYEECDKLGILIWIETPIYCIYPPDNKSNTEFSDLRFSELASTMIEEMVIHARNHPSVVIYGLGNECNTQNPESKNFFQELAEKIKQLDNTRLISYACFYDNIGSIVDLVDILGINEYWGWYDCLDNEKSDENTSNTKASIDLKILSRKLGQFNKEYSKPIIFTEFGADAVPGYLSSSRELWSEDYQADLIRETFSIILENKQVCGAFPFCFSDYRDPSKYINEYWNGMNYKGILTYQRHKKKAFYTLKEIYSNVIP